MPLLKRLTGTFSLAAPASAPDRFFESGQDALDGFRSGLLNRCANPDCHSSWLHLFRDRSTPVFENGWTCSPECTEARVLSALHRELDGRVVSGDTYRHRIPLGLLMLEKNWITREQLREALQAQAAAGNGRLGEWLIKLHATDESTVTRALALQWSCPVLSPDMQDLAVLAFAVPRLFVESFGGMPLRVAHGKLLYLGFEQSLDPVLAFAVGRMIGMRVESGIVPSTLFRPSLGRLLQQKFPSVQLAEAVSESAAAHLLARSIERFHPAVSRLVRLRDCVWLRMISSPAPTAIPQISAISDVICSIAPM